jgi:hypothetical protein
MGIDLGAGRVVVWIHLCFPDRLTANGDRLKQTAENSISTSGAIPEPIARNAAIPVAGWLNNSM